MRDLDFLVAVPALPCLNWVNLGSCSLSIFDFFFLLLLYSKILFGKSGYYPSNSKIQTQKRERGEGREGASMRRGPLK